MGSAPIVLILDDGELADIRDLVSDLGVDFRHIRGRAIDNKVPAPKALLICTPRHAEVVSPPTRGRANSRPLVRIAGCGRRLSHFARTTSQERV